MSFDVYCFCMRCKARHIAMKSETNAKHLRRISIYLFNILSLYYPPDSQESEGGANT